MTMLSMTPEKCPLCGAQIPKTTGRTHIDGTTTYTQYGCDSCLVQFWWPLKNPGTEWYRTNEKYGNRNADPVWDATTNHKKTLAFFLHKKGNVLDIGCGIGNFLSAAKDRGWKCTGIDFDPDAIESAKRATGINDFEATDVESYAAHHPDKNFDLITFFDV